METKKASTKFQGSEVPYFLPSEMKKVLSVKLDGKEVLFDNIKGIFLPGNLKGKNLEILYEVKVKKEKKITG